MTSFQPLIDAFNAEWNASRRLMAANLAEPTGEIEAELAALGTVTIDPATKERIWQRVRAAMGEGDE